MKIYKKYFSLIMIATLSFTGFAQELQSNLFLRTPQLVTYNFNENHIGYSSVVSIGAGLSHNSKFIELATFINDEDVYGFYTFFGKTLKTEQLATNLNLHTNWFGEITYVPEQAQNSDVLIYTSGICFFLNYNFEWGAIGIPLCIGAAYSDETISLNTRTILNLSLNL